MGWKGKRVMNKNNKGFTIIEVVLVLAIAGLIFLVVFLALPALQRNQRDTQRRADLGRTLSAVQTYQGNNNGKAPTDLADFTTKYLKVGDDGYTDPSGTDYSLVAKNVATPADLITEPPEGQIWYYSKGKCDGENVVATTSARNIAVRVNLENGGAYCQDNL